MSEKAKGSWFCC